MCGSQWYLKGQCQGYALRACFRFCGEFMVREILWVETLLRESVEIFILHILFIIDIPKRWSCGRGHREYARRRPSSTGHWIKCKMCRCWMWTEKGWKVWKQVVGFGATDTGGDMATARISKISADDWLQFVFFPSLSSLLKNILQDVNCKAQNCSCKH